MTLVVLYKYMNYTVNETTDTGAEYTTYIIYITNHTMVMIMILVISSCYKPFKKDPFRDTFLPNAHPGKPICVCYCSTFHFDTQKTLS